MLDVKWQIHMSNVKSKSSKKILNPKSEILNKIQPRTTKEFFGNPVSLVVLGWVAQYPSVVLGKIQPRTI